MDQGFKLKEWLKDKLTPADEVSRPGDRKQVPVLLTLVAVRLGRINLCRSHVVIDAFSGVI
jgi:hypothetical protein